MTEERPQTDHSSVTGLMYTDGATGHLRVRRYRVSVLSGPNAGANAEIEGGTFLIGTHPNNDLRLNDQTVSRYHLELQLRAEGLKITDLDSTNGTFQGATRIGSVTVVGATRLKLGGGQTEVEIAPADSDVEVKLFEQDQFGDVIGGSRVMRQLFGLLAQVAPTDATVLLQGETGTGKERLAEGIHAYSTRKNGPFVVVDCAAIPRELIGSELFGHVKGSFTGATMNKRGLIEEADGGTLFLDEIGELAVDMQPQLLRVLEKREVRRIGETRPRRVDIRVVAATNRDLQEMVRAGAFREDLYFRVAVVRAIVPPLRARREDVPELVRHFLQQLGRSDFEVTRDVLAKLMAYEWPGNVRELRNVVERGLSLREPMPIPEPPTLGPSTIVVPSGAPGATPVPPAVLDLPFKEAKGILVEAFEREYLTHLLARHNGNISRAALEAGIDRNYIHRLVKKYGIPVERG
ncbi:MAG TPA: sigma 54-dependent Fis family transcriptional regulator [Polyangia bacterium]|nr:sigma 54-dependent Fis family transcriptional regulator [Polyangia bacterium]